MVKRTYVLPHFYTLQSLQADFSNYASQIHGCASLDKVLE